MTVHLRPAVAAFDAADGWPRSPRPFPTKNEGASGASHLGTGGTIDLHRRWFRLILESGGIILYSVRAYRYSKWGDSLKSSPLDSSCKRHGLSFGDNLHRNRILPCRPPHSTDRSTVHH